MQCNNGWIEVESFQTTTSIYDSPNFNIKSAQTGIFAVQLCIKIEDNAHIKLHLFKRI